MTSTFQEPRPQRPCDLLMHPNGVEAPYPTLCSQLAKHGTSRKAKA